jgi:hypothetical protein
MTELKTDDEAAHINAIKKVLEGEAGAIFAEQILDDFKRMLSEARREGYEQAGKDNYQSFDKIEIEQEARADVFRELKDKAVIRYTNNDDGTIGKEEYVVPLSIIEALKLRMADTDKGD